mgnify:CR=1 FL=1
MKNIILSAIAISVSISAFGWGQTGHRAIGKIAESYLSEKAKKRHTRNYGSRVVS